MSQLSLPIIIGISVTAYFGSVVASMAGIGGGSILIPIYVIITGLPIKDVVVLTMFTIAGNSFCRAIYFFWKKKGNRYLANYQVLRLIIPFDGNVAYLGFLLNRILPNVVIFIMIIVIMAILIYKIFNLLKSYLNNDEENENDVFIVIDNIESKIEIEMKEQHTFVPFDKYGENIEYLGENFVYIAISVGLVAVFSFFRKFVDPGWSVYLVQFFIILMFGFTAIKHIMTEYNLRKNTNFDFVPGDINWNNPVNFVKYCIASSFVGVISTMLGIGGSIIMNPIMLSFHMDPEVVVATSSIGTFFSSVISLIQFIIGGASFEWYYALLFAFGFLASATSLSILRFLKKYVRIIVIGVLFITMVASFFLIIVFNAIDIAKNGVK